MPKAIDLPTATTMDDGDYLLMEESSGGTKKITRADALPATKENVHYSPSISMTSIPSGVTDITSMSLPAGIWVVTGQISVMGGWDGRVGCGISLISGDAQPSGGGASIVRATPSGWSIVNVARIVALSSTTTVYLVGVQESGSNKSINRYDTNMRAVRVG